MKLTTVLFLVVAVFISTPVLAKTCQVDLPVEYKLTSSDRPEDVYISSKNGAEIVLENIDRGQTVRMEFDAAMRAIGRFAPGSSGKFVGSDQFYVKASDRGNNTGVYYIRGVAKDGIICRATLKYNGDKPEFDSEILFIERTLRVNVDGNPTKNPWIDDAARVARLNAPKEPLYYKGVVGFYRIVQDGTVGYVSAGDKPCEFKEYAGRGFSNATLSVKEMAYIGHACWKKIDNKTAEVCITSMDGKTMARCYPATLERVVTDAMRHGIDRPR